MRGGIKIKKFFGIIGYISSFAAIICRFLTIWVRGFEFQLWVTFIIMVSVAVISGAIYGFLRVYR